MEQAAAKKWEAENLGGRAFTLDEVDSINGDIAYIKSVLQLIIHVNDEATNPHALPTCEISCVALDKILMIDEMFNGKKQDSRG